MSGNPRCIARQVKYAPAPASQNGVGPARSCTCPCQPEWCRSCALLPPSFALRDTTADEAEFLSQLRSGSYVALVLNSKFVDYIAATQCEFTEVGLPFGFFEEVNSLRALPGLP